MDRLKTREGVAEILKANGLFIREWVMKCRYMHCTLRPVEGFPNEQCLNCPQLASVPKFEFPTANQTEAIFAKLEVQVVWNYGWEVGVIKDGKDDVPRWRFYFVLPNEIPRNDRDHAQAAAVAWFALKKPEKLKEVMG